MRRVRPRSVSFIAVLGLLWVPVGVASAHVVTSSRFDAPLPLPLLFGGAGFVVAATAFWLARDGSAPRTDTVETISLSSSMLQTGRWALHVAGVVGFSAVLWFGVSGPRAAADNPATLFTWAVALKGVALVSIVTGSPWRSLSPWRTLYEALVTLEGSDIGYVAYPSWLGVWPAVLGFIVLGVTVNLTQIPQSPRLTAGFLAVYALVMVLGAIAFGRTFFERADVLEVFYRLLSRVSPVEWGPDGIRLRPPWAACTNPTHVPGIAAFVIAAVFTVSFDGFLNTPEYQTIHFIVRDVVGVYVDLVLYVFGLVVFVLTYYEVAVVVEELSGRGDARMDVRGAATEFAPTVLPIVAAYEVAHNYPYVAQNLSRLLSLAIGTNVSLLDWLPLSVFWGSQVVLIVVGHILAVVAAHCVATNRYENTALRAHLPLVLLMVGYTVLSLWIISRPLVA